MGNLIITCPKCGRIDNEIILPSGTFRCTCGYLKKLRISSWARLTAESVWCQETTKNRVMDPIVTEEFARILDLYTSIPRLGLATCQDLLDELSARIEVHGPGLNYKTVTGEEDV